MTGVPEFSGVTARTSASIWTIVLSAGSARRMGTQKLLLPDPTGTPIVRHTVHTVLTAMRDFANAAVCVVCSPQQSQVAEAVTGLPVQIVWNPDAALGLSTSLCTGITFAAGHGATAAVIVLADQPELSATVLAKVVNVHRKGSAAITQARYCGVPGHPVAFSDALFTELSQVRGDEGARSVIQTHAAERVFVDFTERPLADVDNPADYQEYLRRSSSP